MANKLDELLKKMGLTMEYEDIPEEKLKIAKIRDPKDLMKGADAMFRVSNDLYKDLPTIEPQGVFLPKEWQGRGLGTELYKELERVTGAKIVPGDDQTEMSHGLHDKRGFGKEFGVKEETLNKLLSPSEKAERDVRKKSLKGGLDSLIGEMQDLSKHGLAPDDFAPEVYKSDIDRKVLGEVEPRNITSLLDNLLKEARRLPSGDQAAEFIKSKIPSTLSKVKSVSPMLLKGLAAGAGGALSLGAEASDSPEAGDVLGQEALERDIAAHKQEQQIEEADVPKEVKLKALELFKKNRLPY